MEKDYFTMSEMARELGVTRQCVFWHIQRGRLAEPVVIGTLPCWRRKDALRFMADYRAGKYPKGPVLGSKMPRKPKEKPENA